MSGVVGASGAVGASGVSGARGVSPEGATAAGRPGDGPPPDLTHERLKAYEGRPTAAAGVGKDLVNEPMIRHWCEAVGDTHPAYRGPDAIAPPTMLQAWTMGGLSGHADRSGAYDELSRLLDSAGYTSIVATDCEQEYLRPLRPGDRITFDSVIESVSERKTTKLGTGHFITTRMDIRADGEPAGTHRFRVLKYAPAARLPKTAERPKATEPAQAVERPKATEPTRAAEQRTAAEQRMSTAAEQSAAAEHRKTPERRPPRRPRPVINRDNAGFWEGVRGHRLLIQRCTGCRTLRFPWLPGCNACGAPDWDTVEASGAGTVFSYVVMHHPPFPAFTVPDQPADGAGPDAAAVPGAAGSDAAGPDAADPGAASPYAVGLIELAEGVRMVSNIVGIPYDKVRIGMPVQLEFLRADEELELPVFRVAEGGEG
ncbi:bifunctional MaoC family dehydratase N-terminal/OB-fold nucleic acid binding domain-containing protein [Streptomyces sp. G7(2002)]|uniref:bifunctional MaoC family dehydratase N-terminal/OB-fold nucleic acid binding domain-containing protein n=1 Tax=Streptomyces sp. G7(2002) TaxID=2971798 RepID=UPI00237E292A|nr:OB-fold domain-containing protein [Streptomyces sp. G7(2002)]WDT56467.1 OB-fold domain-containing protein [Streptomyces sp. G7(2002)]